MEISKVYSEVYEILNILGNDYINKLPERLYENICNERDKNSVKEFDVNKSINEQGINKNTLEFIAYLNLQYWCNEEQKQQLLKQYKENDEKFEQELRKKYNPDKIFENKEEEFNKDNVQLEKFERQNLFRKLWNKIIGLFKVFS